MLPPEKCITHHGLHYLLLYSNNLLYLYNQIIACDNVMIAGSIDIHNMVSGFVVILIRKFCAHIIAVDGWVWTRMEDQLS